MKEVKKNRIRRWLIGTVIVLGLFFILILSANLIIASRLREKLPELVTQKTNGAYQLRVDDASVGVLRGNITLKGLLLTPVAGKTTSSFAIFLKIPEIKLSGLHILTAWKGDKIIFNTLAINEPLVVVFQRKKEKKQEPGTPAPKLHELIASSYKSIEAEKILIERGSIIYRSSEKGDRTKHYISGISAAWNDLQINAEGATDSARSLYSKRIELLIRKHEWQNADSTSTLTTTGLRLTTDSGLLAIESLKITPNFKKGEYSKMKGEQDARIEASFAGIRLQQLNVKRLLEEKAIEAGLLTASKGRMEVFKDKRFPVDHAERKPLPQQALRDLDMPLRIDSVSLSNIDVEYEEMSPQGLGPGVLTFAGINVSAGKISNEKEFLASKPVANMHITTLLMKRSKVDLRLAFMLADSSNTFTCKGRVSSMYLPALNAMVENMGILRFKEGKLDDLSFAITFNENYAVGTARMGYQELRPEMLDKETGKRGLKERIVSKLAHFKIPESNPEDPDEPLRIGKVYFIRDKNKSVFSYLWKSLQTGLLSSMGLEKAAAKVK
jgi:hypothetical protein